MPKLIAGVNGAGKSILFHLLDNLQDMPRINADEIVREFGNWKNPSDVMKAGKSQKKYNSFLKRDALLSKRQPYAKNQLLII